MATTHDYGEQEHQLLSVELDEDESEEYPDSGSSNTLLAEEMALQPHAPTKSGSEMLTLTIGLAGLQSAYCSQFANGTDFLLGIGISPALIASVWIIPPLCGAVLQPLFGILSDALRTRVGRREPLVLLGAVGLLCALLVQAWGPAIANSLDASCDGSWPACPAKIIVSIFAVVLLYTSAQAVQVATRAKMVDECHVGQQLDVNTWASRVISLTSVFYYILSYGLQPLRGIELRMKELALISAILVVATVTIACAAGFQAPPAYRAPRTLPAKHLLERVSYYQQVKETVTTRMSKILVVQFLSSFAWFPYLFYISRYITEKNHDGGKIVERLGPLALFLQSVVHLITSVILPFFVSHTVEKSTLTTVSINIPKLDPVRLWRLSLAIYSACVAGIVLTDSTILMLALAALTGFCWAVTLIVPYTLLTDEFMLRNDGEHRRSTRSGVFLGINNLAITVPQIIAGLICTTIFSTVSEKHTNSLSNGMTISLSAGSVVSLLATVVSFCI
ncbi:hypothetical protein F4777DRAFT_544561 [Nemania sp. FL0916]|nr:hypothetical protein F4777DRAFT_544561 [Nemania sp. FL0916]